ncbi:MAG: hypothetical protein HFE97_07725 [Oscillospiraceae bacterium]|nr:hypothetical protein [Oscillospiraceae bacterium]
MAKTNLDALMKNPDAASILKNKDALLTLMKSPDTKRLMELLNQKAGSGLRTAADAAAKGDPSALAGLVGQLMQSEEGAAVVNRINKKIPQG